MNPSALISSDAKTKIDVLMKEYDTLRQEILARSNNRFSILGLMFAAATALAAFKNTSMLKDISLTTAAWSMAVWLLLMGAVWWSLGRLIYACNRRLVMIERQVNELAGEELLRWETTYSPNTLLRFMAEPPGREPEKRAPEVH